MSDPTATGADLARMALASARRAAKNAPAPTRSRPKRTRTQRGDGRDPMPLGAALTRLMDEHGWDTAVTGGNILDQWNDLCPELAGKVQPVAYDSERGVLQLRPASHAYATQLRWLDRQLCQRINTKVGTAAVRSLRILPVGGTLEQQAAPTEVEPAAAPIPAGPVRTRETASDGYRLALAEHQAHRRTRETAMDAYVRAADERQAQALRARREPETAFTDAVAQTEALEEQAGPAVESLEASIRAALARKHSGGRTEPRRLFEAS